MNINTVDLNLFLAFQAIYATRSVTLAGERLGMTQSAVSNALKRTRERFNDPLFVRTTEGMVPTLLADRLIGFVEAGILQFTQAIDQGQSFDAKTSKRVFRLAINDIGQLVMMPSLLTEARRQAPSVSFETVDASLADAKQKMTHGHVDLALGSWEPVGDTFYQQRLFDETFVVLMRKSNPLADDGLTLDRYLAAEHIAYRPSGATDSELVQTLSRAGAMERRQVVLTAAHSLGLSSIVAASDLLLTVPARLAGAMIATRDDLHVAAAPFDIVPFTIRQQWHERFHMDPGNRWLRQLVFSLFQQNAERPSLEATVAHSVAANAPFIRLAASGGTLEIDPRPLSSAGQVVRERDDTDSRSISVSTGT